MRMILTGILAILVLSACSGGGSANVTPADKPGAGATGAEGNAAKPAPTEITTGDVEQKIMINGSVPEASHGPNVKINAIKDPRGKINMTTVDVYQPFPEHLPLLFHIKSGQDWESTPVVFRGKVTIEGNPEPLGQTQFVWGKGAVMNPRDLTVDLMPALPTVPDSILVVMRADVMLMPVGTDAKVVDPATATAPEISSTILMSNPIRINFHQEAAPAVEGAAPVVAPAQAVTPVAPGQ